MGKKRSRISWGIKRRNRLVHGCMCGEGGSHHGFSRQHSPVQSKNFCLSNEPSLPNPQFLTDGDPRPYEVWGEKLDAHDAGLARPQRSCFSHIKTPVKEIPIDAQRTAPPNGWRRPCSSARIRWKQPQLDKGIRRPKCHSVSFSRGSIQPRNRL